MSKVAANVYQDFMNVVTYMSHNLGLDKDKDIKFCLDELLKAIEYKVFEIEHPKEEALPDGEFIVIWKNMYLEESSFEYTAEIRKPEIGAIRNLCKKLRDEVCTTPEQYLSWFFRVYMQTPAQKNNQGAPDIKWACSNVVYDKFRYNNRELIEERIQGELTEREKLALGRRIREVSRDPNLSNEARQALKQGIIDQREGKITIWQLKKILSSYTSGVVKKRKKVV
jgi:hypothetical protein